jgi:very-short-patch-repair endonuclease
MSEVDHQLASLAVRQHAHLSDVQALDLGLTPRMRASRLRAGRLVRAAPGVLRMPGAPLTYQAVLMSAVLAAGTDAVVSHRSAAALWTFDGFRPGVVEVTVPRGHWHRPSGAVAHESTDLDRTSHRRVDGIPVTAPDRTILDIALRTSDRRLVAAIDSARRRSLTSWDGLTATLLRHARRGRPGVARLRRVIAGHVSQAEVTDSIFESLVLSLLREHGLPDPVLHHRVLSPRGELIAEVDLAYPLRRIAIELDGLVHLDRDVWERDRPRQNRLELLGWTVLRFSWRTLVERPEVIVAEVSAALRSAPAA